jgi:hypothetical protein
MEVVAQSCIIIEVNGETSSVEAGPYFAIALAVV